MGEVKPISQGRIIALHAAEAISSEEAAALTVARMPPPVEAWPAWVKIGFALWLGFVAGEARVTWLEAKIPHAVYGGAD